MNKPSETDPSKTKKNFQYFKLSFIGAFSKFTENELQKLTRQICKDGTILKFLTAHLNWCLFFQLRIGFHMV